jgi:phospholipase C
METRRSFLQKTSILSGGAGLLHVLPASIAKALAIDPEPGSTFLDAEHIVFLMQENRSFDHTYGTLQGVRGFNDPRALRMANENLVWLQSNEKGETYAPFRFDIKNTRITWMDSLPHGWADQVDARNNGKYDQWLTAKRTGKEEYKHMPLTLGYYTRADIPFYYSLADAFTVCDQHFCSSLTGTTPNRLFFWTGTIREKDDEKALANVWNQDADYDTMVSWKTFPERLEEWGIPWKIYQNEISVGVGLSEEEDAWLANFGDNPLEYFTQYHSKLAPGYIANLPRAIAQLEDSIRKREEKLNATVSGSKDAENLKGEIEWLKKRLAATRHDQETCTLAQFEQLPEFQKSIHRKAFSTNNQDPYYHQLDSLKYKDGDQEHEVNVPRGDILHEFRQDVRNGKLPLVSWLVAPQNFSDHPSSAWYGAWYISEVMDILTQNPEIWKKTVFVLTYDENDGYFDHVPPFVAPHPYKHETGLTSKGIHTGVEYVANAEQQSVKDQVRESAIGLGYRVPLVIASPWSRGGWVNSQVFDHTSSLRFLEKFLTHKTGRNISEPNISAWRRTVCGDLVSAFRPYNGEKLKKPGLLERDEFIESIHKAQFRNPPSNYRRLDKEEIAGINQSPQNSSLLPAQEKGTRDSCALPYELYVDEAFDTNHKTLTLNFRCDNKIFGAKALGSPFQVYAPGLYQNQTMSNRDYAVAAGDSLADQWKIEDFAGNLYHLRVYGPNGFYRELKGSPADPALTIRCDYGDNLSTALSRARTLRFHLDYLGEQALAVEIIDNAYKLPRQVIRWKNGLQKKTGLVNYDLEKSFGWYDFTIRVKGNEQLTRRYAGRVETGRHSKTDPFMGRVV